MSHLQYFTYPGFGEAALERSHYSQAVRIGDKIEISGQGGWDRATGEIPTDHGVEIDQTFDNIAYTIQQAGGRGFEQVYKLRVYIVDWTDEAAARLVENMKRSFTGHQPLMTVIGVPKLYSTMKIEIEAEAHLG